MEKKTTVGLKTDKKNKTKRDSEGVWTRTRVNLQQMERAAGFKKIPNQF